MVEGVEAKYLALQRDRFSKLVRSKEELEKFIMELQQSVLRQFGAPAWEYFRQTGAWDRLQEYASAEDQYRFHQEWVRICELTHGRR